MRVLSTIAIVLTAVSISACTTAPIMNVDRASVGMSTGKTLTQEQVRSAILRAGAALGWQMRDEGPGMIVGTLRLRDHLAVVDIPYSTTNYSITYKSSANLQESGGTIHKNYNGWIQNLTRVIGTQLSTS